MENNNKNTDQLDNQDLPELSEDLQALFTSNKLPPSQIDQTILHRAEQHLHPLGRSRTNTKLLRWSGVAVAIAACLMIMFWMNISDTAKQIQPPNMIAVNPKDINNNGKVDIMDAFTLAKAIENNKTPQATWDINKDHKINQQDVDAIALAAVQLSQGVL